jgi:streptomycin 6-kinase
MPGGCWLDIVVAQSGLQRKRLLQWIIAWTGLSAAWFIGDGDDPAVDLAVSALGTAAKDRRVVARGGIVR